MQGNESLASGRAIGEPVGFATLQEVFMSSVKSPDSLSSSPWPASPAAPQIPASPPIDRVKAQDLTSLGNTFDKLLASMMNSLTGRGTVTETGAKPLLTTSSQHLLSTNGHNIVEGTVVKIEGTALGEAIKAKQGIW